MIVFFQKHWVSLGLFVVCAIIGTVTLIRRTPIDIWRIDYEYHVENRSTLPRIAVSDTVFRYKGVVCRNYTGSISDTLRNIGIGRHEMQVYLKRPSKEQAMRIGKEVFPSENITIINQRFRETQRSKRGLLNWILVGFFLGTVAEFIIALKK